MMSAEIFLDKIAEIESRMDYVVENWNYDKISSQELRYVCIAYLNGLYKNKKVEYLAKRYLLKVKEKNRLDIETLLAALASIFIVKQQYQSYFRQIINRLNISKNQEKYILSLQLLLILTPDILNKLSKEDRRYIKDLLSELKNQNLEEKLFSYWIEKRLFSYKIKEKLNYPIENIKEYLLLELLDIEYDYKKEKLRENFYPYIKSYKVNRIDLITYLLYQFFKKYKISIITEKELNQITADKVKKAITRKVWFPVLSSMIFVISKMYLEKIMTLNTLLEVSIFIVGTICLFYEEKFPTILLPITRKPINFGKLGELLICVSIALIYGINTASIIFNLLIFI